MAFTLQDDTGTVTGANAYVSVAEFKAYHDDRGNDYASIVSVDPDDIEDAIVKATDYIDGRFRFVGEKRAGRDQVTEWPRTGAYDRDRYYVNDIPIEVKEAVMEYAFRALSADINPDPVRDDTGRVVQSKSEKVGPISESITYVNGGSYQFPKYPAADNRLLRTGLVITGGQVVRG